MEPQQAIDLGSAAVMLAVLLAAPVLLVGMVVGLLISIVQAVTQLQDQTLSFVPKLAAMAAAAMFFLPWLTQQTVDYAERVNDSLKTANIDDVKADWKADEKTLHLSGEVERAADKARAEQLASQVVGTSGRVVNEVKVEGTNAGETDDRIEEQLGKMFEDRTEWDFDGRGVTFDSEAGVVTITGDGTNGGSNTVTIRQDDATDTLRVTYDATITAIVGFRPGRFDPFTGRYIPPRFITVSQAINLSQNFVSSSLWIRSCLTYFVSGGGAISGISRSTVRATGAPPDPTVTHLGTLYRFPGLRFHCCPSPRSGGSFTTWPSLRRKVSYRLRTAWTQYRPGGRLRSERIG